MATLTPQEEYDKSLVVASREMEKTTASLRAPFKDLIGNIQNTNQHMAKIATDHIGQTQDTWKGLITAGKKEKLIRDAHNDEFKEHSKQVKESQKREAGLRNQSLLDEISADERVRKAKEKSSEQKVSSKDKLDAISESRTKLKQRQEKEKDHRAQEHFKRELEKLGAQEGVLNKLQAIKQKEVDEAEKAAEDQKKLFEDNIKKEKTGRHESEKLIDETNEQLEHNLEQAGKTENYDKFTGSIKTLSGGFIDIAGVLDPIAKQFGALKDLSASLGLDKVYKKITGGFEQFHSFVTKGKKEQLEQSEVFKETSEGLVDSIASQQKKTTKGFSSLIKEVGITGIVLALLGLAIFGLMARFEAFDKFIRNMMGWNPLEEQTKTSFDGAKAQLAAGEIDDKKFLELTAPMIEQQELRAKDLEFNENVRDRASETAAVTSRTAHLVAKAVKPTITSAVAVQNARDLAGDATKLNKVGVRNNAQGDFVKKATKTQKFVAGTGAKVTHYANTKIAKGLKTVAKRAATPIAVLMAGWEVKNALGETDDMEEKLLEMHAMGEITDAQRDEGLELVEKKKYEDVAKPVAAAAAGVAAASAAATLAAPLLALPFAGWLAYGLVVATAGAVGALTVDAAVDTLMTADDSLNEILGDESLDAGDVRNDLNEMKKTFEEKGGVLNLEGNVSTSGVDIATGTEELAHIGNSTPLTVQAVVDGSYHSNTSQSTLSLNDTQQVTDGDHTLALEGT